jgi:DNA-binding PadR family transcriptional regulator
MFGHHHHSRHGRGEHRCAPRGGDPFGEPGGGYRGGFGRGGGWGGGPRGPRGARPLDQGDLRVILLDLIAEKPRHGYELIKAIEDAMDGHYAPSPGVVYPTLTLMEETGLIASETQGVKKLYSLTEDGRAHLAAEAEAVTAAKARMEEARRRFGPPPAAEIGRAMGNLANALRLRLSRGPLSEEELRRLVDAIDAAATGVERS